MFMVDSVVFVNSCTVVLCTVRMGRLKFLVWCLITVVQLFHIRIDRR